MGSPIDTHRPSRRQTPTRAQPYPAGARPACAEPWGRIAIQELRPRGGAPTNPAAIADKAHLGFQLRHGHHEHRRAEVAALPRVEAIATGDIALRADLDERFVQDVLAHTNRRDPGIALGQSLDEMFAGVHKLESRFKQDELRGLSALHLESLDRHWTFYGKQLDAWRRDLQRATAIYSTDAAELATRRAAWEATRTAAEASGVAPALDDRITTVLAEIERLAGAPLDVSTSDWRQGDQRYFVADTRALEATLGWRRTIAWRDGVARLTEELRHVLPARVEAAA